MVTINKVYTRTGDKGETSLVGGRRLPKDHVRIETYGTTDELNSVIGLARALVFQEEHTTDWHSFEEILQAIQQKLFDLGSELATHEADSYPGQIKMEESDVLWLESLIDALNSQLPSLQSFVLPGGTLLNAQLHQARTICRRAERLVIRLNAEATVNPYLKMFLNRLSDLLFVMARWASKRSANPEPLWRPKSTLPAWRH
jgi:cob(I)alamin adenosyltransferase